MAEPGTPQTPWSPNRRGSEPLQQLPHSQEIATQGGTPPPVHGDMRQSGRKETSAHRMSVYRSPQLVPQQATLAPVGVARTLGFGFMELAAGPPSRWIVTLATFR